MSKSEEVRFPFGRNWREFVEGLDERRIQRAERSVAELLGTVRLDGKRFLDAGCGSGLFSLAALRLGAAEVVSFDYDADSVACAHVLNETYGPFPQWKILRGDVLDGAWVRSLGEFDIVYSWGVLHHTGAMWRALDEIVRSVARSGLLVVSLYNDQGWRSRLWGAVKRTYTRSPPTFQSLLVFGYFSVVLAYRTVVGLSRGVPLREWYTGSERGMSLWHDTVDWMGGYPFETATPSAVIDFFCKRGLGACRVRLTRGTGCNEFVLAQLARTSPGGA